MFLSLAIYAEEPKATFSLQSKLMEGDWKFLPDVPQSFKKTTSNSYGILTNYKKFYFEIESKEIDLSLKRSNEPIDVSLNAKKLLSKLSYKINSDLMIYVKKYSQDATDQRFNCYSFNELIIGSCPNASISITSSNPKYEVLGESLVMVTGEVSSITLGFKKFFDNDFISDIDLSYEQVDHKFDWLSPIEDISSPTLLGLDVGDSTLGEEIDKVLITLPQREGWKTNILNLNAHNQFKLGSNIALEPSLYLKFLNFKNYNNLSSVPRFNIKFRLGLSFSFDKTRFTFFGDYYHNNLLGFENIAFNQRTERFFNKPYGELGLKVELSF